MALTSLRLRRATSRAQASGAPAGPCSTNGSNRLRDLVRSDPELAAASVTNGVGRVPAGAAVRERGLGPAHAPASMLMVSVLRIAAEPLPAIGRTECQELKVLTNTTAWLGVNAKLSTTSMSSNPA